MTEKSTGKFLLQLEETFANKNPVLMQTAKAYHELDQINFDLGFIDMDESVASKLSWWPVVTLIGSPDSGKAEFINQHLKTEVFQTGVTASNSKFSVLFHGDNEHVVTLPGTAVDRDSRFPFYHFSDKIEMIQEGEGRQINSYMELKTCNSSALKGKILISAPNFATDPYNEISPFIMDHLAQISDLVLVFFDANSTDFESIQLSFQKFIETANKNHNPDKFIFIINQPDTDAAAVNLDEWKNKLAELGLISGRFFALQKAKEVKAPAKDNRLFAQVTDFGQQDQINKSDLSAVEKLIEHVAIDSAYRIVGAFDNSVHEVEDVAMREVRNGIKMWKDRSHFTITLVLSVLAIMLVMGELQVGFLAVLIDPIIGPIALLVLIVIMVPLHIYSSKQHAKFVMKELNRRQRELGLVENLAAVFEQNVTKWRILLPTREHIGWNKTIKSRLSALQERSKELVQMLNDSFSSTGNKTSF